MINRTRIAYTYKSKKPIACTAYTCSAVIYSLISFFYSEIKPSKKAKYWCIVDTDEWRCIFLIFLSLKKKKAPKKSINHPFINHISIHEIKNLYKYMLKTYTLTIIHKKKFISNGMISFNLHTVSIAHPSAKSQAP